MTTSRPLDERLALAELRLDAMAAADREAADASRSILHCLQEGARKLDVLLERSESQGRALSELRQDLEEARDRAEATDGRLAVCEARLAQAVADLGAASVKLSDQAVELGWIRGTLATLAGVVALLGLQGLRQLFGS